MNLADDDKRPQFGSRLLNDPSKVFDHNAWDHVKWDEEQEQQAKEKVEKNSSVPVPEDLKVKYENEAHKYWDKFYNIHENHFFKDRHWLFTEFPELSPNKDISGSLRHCIENLRINDKTETAHENSNDMSKEESPKSEYPGANAKMRILEVGCGVGNTVFPLLSTNNAEDLFVYCCDFSDVAVSILKENPDYDKSRCHAFVCDVTSEVWNVPFPEGSLDIVILIFVLSAINPNRMQHVINSVVKYLKPGGLLLFRDYGLYDMAQLRFKPGSCLGENFYARGDGTLVYFFKEDEVHNLFCDAGLQKEFLLTDRRLQVNRGKMLKMYRVWILAKYRKPCLPAS